MDQTFILTNGEKGSAKIDVLFSEFPDKDSHCLVNDIEALKGKPALVFHRLYPDQNNQIFKLVLLLDLLKGAGVSSLCVFAPYLPYSRQDKQHVAGEAGSLDSVCKILSGVGCDGLYTLDCHFMKGSRQTIRSGLRINNVSLGPALLGIVKTMIGSADYEVIGPDQGANYLTHDYGAKTMNKHRGDYQKIKEGDSYRQVAELKSDHLSITSDKTIIIDDMISTGSTIIKAIENLESHGVKDIYCVVTHGLFLGDSFQKITSLTKGLVFSDSIVHPKSSALVQTVLDDVIVPDWLKSSNHN